MVKSIIDDIFFDNGEYYDNIKPSEEYKELSDKGYKLYKKLIESLNEEQKILFNEFADCHIDVCAETERTHFKAGLKAGMLMLIECLNF